MCIYVEEERGNVRTNYSDLYIKHRYAKEDW